MWEAALRRSEADAGAMMLRMPDGSRAVRPMPALPAVGHARRRAVVRAEHGPDRLPKKVSLDAFMSALEPHVLASATLVAKFTKIRANEIAREGPL
jgi:hypothetical protein